MKLRTKFVFVFDIIYESGKCSHKLFFRRFIMRIKNPNAKRGAHSKDLEASAQKKMDDALADMLSGKN